MPEVSILSSTSRPPATDYRELKAIISAEGLLAPSPVYYVTKTVIALATLAAAIVIAVVATNPAIVLFDAVFLGFASTQVALLAHDVGHRQGFRGRRTNRIARTFFGNLLLGVSHTWWNTKHNQHHASPNHIDDDPDIRLPFIAFARDQVARQPRLTRPLLAIQGFVLPMMFPLQSIAMRITSVGHLLKGPSRHPWVEAFFMALHVVLYGLLLWSLGSVWLALGFFVIHQGSFGLYNSSVFASNHKGMQLIRPGERLDFLREQVLTSRNIRAHRFVDFWYGGLNYQVEHHLFPTMPRNNLRRAQPIVRDFCRRKGIPYHETGLFECYAEIFRHLQQVGTSETTVEEAKRQAA